MIVDIRRSLMVILTLIVAFAICSVAFCDETYAISKPGQVKELKVSNVMNAH